MCYEVANDNRIIVMGYYMAQDTEGDIHIYKANNMEYIRTVEYYKVFPTEEFKKFCCKYYALAEQKGV